METLIRAIYNEDENKFVSYNNLFNEKYNGWGVIHYIIDSNWFKGVELYLANGGNINLLTDDFIYHNNMANLYIIGGRNALFNTNNSTMVEFLFNHGIVDILDSNGNHYTDAQKVEKNLKQYKENYNMVINRINSQFRKELSPPIEMIQKNILNEGKIQTYLLPHEFHNVVENFDDLDYSRTLTNSIHYQSYPVNIKNSFISSIVNYFMSLEETKNFSITKITGFMIEYDTLYQKELKAHKDDSSYTINICIIEPEIGAELLFTDLNVEIQQKKYEIYFHRGCEEHLVKPLVQGKKKNIIIWIK